MMMIKRQEKKNDDKISNSKPDDQKWNFNTRKNGQLTQNIDQFQLPVDKTTIMMMTMEKKFVTKYSPNNQQYTVILWCKKNWLNITIIQILGNHQQWWW